MYRRSSTICKGPHTLEKYRGLPKRILHIHTLTQWPSTSWISRPPLVLTICTQRILFYMLEDQIEHHTEGTGYWHPWDHQHPNYNPAAPPLTLEISKASRLGQLSWSFSQDPDLSPFVTPRHHLSDSESEDSNKLEQSTRTPLVLQAPVLTAHQEEEEEPLIPGEQVYLQILQQATNTLNPRLFN